MLELTDYLRDPVDNVVQTGLSLNFNSWAELKTAYQFGDVFPDSVDSGWSVSGNVKANDYLSFQFFFSPYTNQESYGCSSSLSLVNTASEQANLTIGWKHQTYEYSRDPFDLDHQMTTEHDYYTASFTYIW